VKTSIILDKRNLIGSKETSQKIGNSLCSGHSPSSEHHPQEYKVPELLDRAHEQDGNADD
jgi:hypothetical protein